MDILTFIKVQYNIRKIKTQNEHAQIAHHCCPTDALNMGLAQVHK